MCGCGKKSTVMKPPVQRTPGEAVAAARAANQVQMYDVHDTGGGLVASFSNPASARAEARRLGGTSVPRGTQSSPAPAGE